MNKKDYYEILNVNKNATDEEIKRSFRKLAKQYHPDINKEAGAEEKFKEIGEAYAVLSDPNKRAQYDQFGHAAFQNGGGAGGANGFSGFNMGDIDLEDILGDLFGGGFRGFSGFGSSSRSSRPTKGSDLRAVINLSFEESVFGCEKDIKINVTNKCSKCNGKGGFNEKTCHRCGGAGKVLEQAQTIFGYMQTQKTCPDCKGSGQKYETICNDCRGQGIVEKTKTLTVTIPEGVDEGSRLRLSGKGNTGLNGGPNGDIFLEFKIEEHPLFERDNSDIYLEVPITIADAALGCKKEIPTLYGNIMLEIKAGTQNYTKLKIKGKGIKTPNRLTKGDMYAVVNIIIPNKLDRKQKSLLQDLAKTNLEDAPEFKTFKKFLK